jgi:hypothetical protein
VLLAVAVQVGGRGVTVPVGLGVGVTVGGTSGTPLTASAWSAPEASALMPANDRLRRGIVRLPVVPSPSWPCPFSPHAHTDPSEPSARLWSRPAATATIDPARAAQSC